MNELTSRTFYITQLVQFGWADVICQNWWRGGGEQYPPHTHFVSTALLWFMWTFLRHAFRSCFPINSIYLLHCAIVWKITSHFPSTAVVQHLGNWRGSTDLAVHLFMVPANLWILTKFISVTYVGKNQDSMIFPLLRSWLENFRFIECTIDFFHDISKTWKLHNRNIFILNDLSSNWHPTDDQRFQLSKWRKVQKQVDFVYISINLFIWAFGASIFLSTSEHSDGPILSIFLLSRPYLT